MKLLSMSIRNFLSFAGEPSTVQLGDVGLVRIEGKNLDDPTVADNGAGKSTIADALVWCLFGETAQHAVSLAGDDVVNRFAGKDCFVTVRFEVNGRLYTVMRGRGCESKELRAYFGGKPNGLAFQVTDSEDDPVDGNVLTKGTMPDTQRAIERVLGLSATAFRHAAVFTQTKAYRFATLPDAEKKAVIDEMVGSEVYARAQKLATEKMRKAAAEMETAKREVNTLTDGIKDVQERVASLKEKRERADAAVKRAVEDAEAEAVRLTKKAKELVEKHKGLADAYDKEKAARRALSEAETAWEKARRASSKAYGACESAKEQLNKLRDAVTKVDTLAGKTCPTCKQEVPHSHIEDVAREAEKLVKQYQRETVAPLAEHYTAADAAAADAELKVRELRAELEKARKRATEADGVQLAMESVKEKAEDAQRVAARLRKEGTVDYDKLIEDERARLKKLKEQRLAARTLVEKLEQDEAALAFWQEGFGTKGIRSLMLDSVLPFLNDRLRFYTSALTQDAIEVELRTQRELKGGTKREELHVAVTNHHGAETYNALSIGERAKVDLVVGLALQDMAASRSRVPINVAFFDEVFDGLDPVACGIAADMLVSALKKRESVFVITHEPALQTYIERTIRVVKKGHKASIET
jgi:DNA repair exonuclease SbcCD ATPase subunit